MPGSEGRMTSVAGVLVAGGASSRMGEPKADLDWFGRPLLAHVVDVLVEAVGRVVVVRAGDQEVPPLPSEVVVVADDVADEGPLRGMAAGMRELVRGGDAPDVAFVSAVDVPLLHPAFVRAVVAALGPAHEVALPVLDERRHPLAAAYRLTAVEPLIEDLLAQGERRVMRIAEECATVEIDAASLPHPESLCNANTPEEFEALRALRGTT